MLKLAYNAWLAAAARRATRARNKRYTYGDQWGDTVVNRDGATVTEAQFLRENGHTPLANNLIRRLVKTIIGHYRTAADATSRYSSLPDDVVSVNALPELDARALEEFLISGCAIQRICRENRPAGSAVWIDNVSPDMFFTNDFRDPRGYDIDLIGMLHDMPPAQVLARFAPDNRPRARQLMQIFKTANEDPLSHPLSDNVDFFRARAGRWRLIELWTLSPREKAFVVDTDNATLSTASVDEISPEDLDSDPDTVWRMDFVWHCWWMAPDGTVIADYDSPFEHGSHPFALKFYPLTDGEVHPFVGDLIDQQHYINRVVVLIDRMLGASAKGVLMFPVAQKVGDMTLDDIAERWSRVDGVIPITGRTNILPQQISSASSDAGAYKLLQLELDLFNKAAGVSQSLTGEADSPTTGIQRFDAQVRNATAALADILESFKAFLTLRTRKAAALL